MARMHDPQSIVLTSAISEVFLRRLAKQGYIRYTEGSDIVETREDLIEDGNPDGGGLKEMDEKLKKWVFALYVQEYVSQLNEEISLLCDLICLVVSKISRIWSFIALAALVWCSSYPAQQACLVSYQYFLCATSTYSRRDQREIRPCLGIAFWWRSMLSLFLLKKANSSFLFPASIIQFAQNFVGYDGWYLTDPPPSRM